MNNVTAVKGMNDLLYPEVKAWQQIESTSRDVFESYGFQEIRTPILESLNLFVRGVGTNTDIVEKEMYVLHDRGDKHLVMRPEGTAGVVRALLQHGVLKQEVERKCFYIGPMFRRERPQKGRLRQFFQIGAEVFGFDSAEADVEVIAMVHDLLESFGVKKTVLRINSLGSSDERKVLVDKLRAYFGKHEKDLCADCQRRLSKNPLRMLDCKQENCIRLAKKAPKILSFLSADSLKHFETVKKGLNCLGIDFVVDEYLVRGIDYYTNTVFEVSVEEGLGSQNTIAAGGRYNGLVETLGGKSTPAFGFSAGIERIIMLLQNKPSESEKPLDTVLVFADEEGKKEAYSLLYQLRKSRIKADIDHNGKSLKSQMRRADRLNSRSVIVLGAKEVKERKAVVKMLSKKETKEVSLDIESIRKAFD